MPRGYRSTLVAVAGLVILLSGVWYGLEQQANFQQIADEQHAEYSARAADQIQRVCRSKKGPLERPDCIKQEVAEYCLKNRDN